MMKQRKYIPVIFTIVLLIVFMMIPIVSNADININPEDFKLTGITGADDFVSKANIIIGVIQAVGSIVAVVALIILGIRYMFAGVDERADYKSTMIPYVVGFVMLLIVVNVLGIIYDIVQNNFN